MSFPKGLDFQIFMLLFFIYFILCSVTYQLLHVAHFCIIEEEVFHYYIRNLFHIICAIFWPLFLLWVLISWIFKLNNVYIKIFKLWQKY